MISVSKIFKKMKKFYNKVSTNFQSCCKYINKQQLNTKHAQIAYMTIF